LAEREGFEPSIFRRISIRYEVAVSSSCARKAEKSPALGYLMIT
jgi:hypothetical protein